jgi:hypothetical protein
MLLLTAHMLSLTAHMLSFTAHMLSLTAHMLSLTAHCSPLTTHILASLEVVETSHYNRNTHRIEDNGVASYLNKFLVNS